MFTARSEFFENCMSLRVGENRCLCRAEPLSNMWQNGRGSYPSTYYVVDPILACAKPKSAETQ